MSLESEAVDTWKLRWKTGDRPNVLEDTELWFHHFLSKACAVEPFGLPHTEEPRPVLPLSRFTRNSRGHFSLSSNEAILQYRNGNWQKPSSGVFLAPSRTYQPEQVKEYLAVTFAPRFHYEWPAETADEMWRLGERTFVDVYESGEPYNRVWPAFGKLGGGLETILTVGGLTAPQPTVLEGGEDDEWRFDSTQTADLLDLNKNLAEVLVEAMGRTPVPATEGNPEIDDRDDDREVEDASAKTVGSGVAVTATIGSWKVTLSCAYREHGGHLEIKVWVVIWKDLLFHRILTAPVSVRRTFMGISSKKDLLEALSDEEDQGTDEGGAKTLLQDALDDVIGNLPGRQHFEGDLYWFYLPAPFLNVDCARIRRLARDSSYPTGD